MTAGTSALLLLVAGGTAGVAALAADEPAVVTAGPAELTVPGGIGAGVGEAEDPPPAHHADRPVPHRPRRAPGIAVGIAPRETPATKTPEPTEPAKTEEPRTTASTTPTAKASAPARPVVTTRTEVETRSIPFRTRLIRDPALPHGTKDVRSEGEAGVRSLRYLITLTDGKRTGRRLLDVTVTKPPTQRLVAIGVGPDPDQDTGEDDGDDEPFGCGPGGPDDDLCLPFGRSAATCGESGEDGGHDSAGSGAGMIVLGDSVIDDEDIGLPDGYDWAC